MPAASALVPAPPALAFPLRCEASPAFLPGSRPVLEVAKASAVAFVNAKRC